MTEQFWIDSPYSLLYSINMLPCSDMSMPSQINSLTRLILVLFLIFAMINFSSSLYFLIISVFLIIILCYVQRKNMQNKKIENYCRTGTGADYNSSFNNSGFNSQFKENIPDVVFAPSGYTRGIVGYTPANLGALAPTTIAKSRSGKNIVDTLIETPQALTFCNDEVSIDPPNNLAVSINQHLAGKAGQLTRIPPVVIAPSHDLSYWRDNDLIVHSAINSEGIQKDMYLSGYAESTCCGYIGNGAQLVPETPEYKNVYIGGNIENYQSDKRVSNCSSNERCSMRPTKNEQFSRCKGDLNKYPPASKGIISPTPAVDIPMIPMIPVARDPTAFKYENYNSNRSCSIWPTENEQFSRCKGDLNRYPSAGRGIISPTPAVDIPMIPSIPVPRDPTAIQYRENYKYTTRPNNNDFIVQPNQAGWVNDECSYNADQTNVFLPSNYPAGNCEQNPALAQYNKNLFTQIVSPGVYTRSEVNEPINSNIGISFQQQFEPVSCERNENGLEYTQHDPRIVRPAAETEDYSVDERAVADNITDPRFWGYGTSYRTYVDDLTGQPKFMYDDVNAIRQPNYITRSKIDHLPYADSYGPDNSAASSANSAANTVDSANSRSEWEVGNVHNPNIRPLVQDSWFRDSMQFRNDLTERRMRKINAEKWQQRVAPLGPRHVGS